MAQLVARDVWDVDAAGSNPVTPTKTASFNIVAGGFMRLYNRVTMQTSFYSQIQKTIEKE